MDNAQLAAGRKRRWPERTLLERFEEKYVAIPEAGCWIWTAHTDPLGYGKICITNRPKIMEGAHRLSYRLFKGEIGDKLVLHRCDTPSCVNPNHLFLGTNDDNMKDMARKNRANRFSQKRTHCLKGHLYTPETTSIRISSKGYPKRTCKICRRARERKGNQNGS